MTNKKSRRIFEDGFRAPEKVCILAPGPNGKPHWSRIDCPVIAVNYAVHIELPTHLPGQDGAEKRHPEMWLAADWWAIKTDWFLPVDKTYKGIRLFSVGLISKRPANSIQADWSFRFTAGKQCVMPLGSGQYTPHPSEFRPDGTSSCLAIEMAARFGTREIMVCGADFRGGRYYDNYIRKGSENKKREGPGVWAYLPFANSLISWVRARGISIYSLSETELDLEVCSAK